jgi:hypothetical protein
MILPHISLIGQRSRILTLMTYDLDTWNTISQGPYLFFRSRKAIRSNKVVFNESGRDARGPSKTVPG